MKRNAFLFMAGFILGIPGFALANSAYDANLSQQSGELGRALNDMNTIDLTVYSADLHGKRMLNPDIPLVASSINSENYPNSASIVKVRANLVYQVESLAMALRENVQTMNQCGKDEKCAAGREIVFDQKEQLHSQIQALSDFDSSVKAAFNQGRGRAENTAGPCRNVSDSSSHSGSSTTQSSLSAIASSITAK